MLDPALRRRDDSITSLKSARPTGRRGSRFCGCAAPYEPMAEDIDLIDVAHRTEGFSAPIWKS